VTYWLGLEGWQTLVVILSVIVAITFVILIVLTRNPLRHYLRVGFFIERDLLDLPKKEHEGWPEIEHTQDYTTAELPAVEQKKEPPPE
jgi:hypothetical protein